MTSASMKSAALILLLTGCALAHRPPDRLVEPDPVVSVDQAEVFTMDPRFAFAQMKFSQTAAATAPPRDRITRIPLVWDYFVPVETFFLALGATNGIWTECFVVGPGKSFTLLKTNWSERSIGHFFVVIARRPSQLSPQSAAIHWPPFPPDRIAIAWTNSGPDELLWTDRFDGSAWLVVKTITAPGEMIFKDLNEDPYGFFALRSWSTTPPAQRAGLFYRTFNPLNL